MNTTVSATNMQVKAVAEKGLLINEVQAADSTTWDDVATAAQTSSKLSLLYPASTADGTNWFHGASKKSSSSASASSEQISEDFVYGTYEAVPAENNLTAISGMSITDANVAGNSQAKYSTMGTAADAEAGYYVHYIYYLKGASGSAISLAKTAGEMNVQITEVKATLPSGEGNPKSGNLDKAVRVGIRMKTGGDFYIYAPVAGATSSYYVAAWKDPTLAKAGNVVTYTDLAELPAITSAGVPVDVYIWFEGEDANCTSDNANKAALDNIQIDIKFSLDTVKTTIVGEISTTNTIEIGTKTYYKVGDTDYYADESTYNADSTKFYTISGGTGEEVATQVPGTVIYSAS